MTERLPVLYFTLLHKPDMRIFAVLDPNRRISDKSRSPNPEKSVEPPAITCNFFFVYKVTYIRLTGTRVSKK